MGTLVNAEIKNEKNENVDKLKFNNYDNISIDSYKDESKGISGAIQSYSDTSFLEESMEERTEELSASSTMLKAMMLLRQTSRRKKRYTEDGRLCASAFAQDGQTYFDCTATRSPDGKNGMKEWCYVDASAKGDKPWDYCRPIMDYDKVREGNQEELRQFEIEARKTHKDIEDQLGPGQQALDMLKRNRVGQAELDAKINKLIKEISTINNNIQNLFNTKDQWEKQEEQAVNIAQKSNARRDKKKEDEMNNQPVEMDKSEEVTKKEITESKCMVAPFLQERMVKSGFDCNGMLMYEEDPRGDGLVGQYFDNESFLGDFIEQKDTNIDFDWTGASPTDGVNPYNFSVRWEGFILAPVTSNYQFAIECDDGATVTINNEILVSHNMFAASEESKSRVDKWLKQEVEKRHNPSKNYRKSISQPIKLTGGNKFKIVVSYYHSVHDDIQDNEKTFIKLCWQSDDFEERIINKNYLYTQNSYPPLKLSGFNSQTGVLRKLLENDLAFKNSEEYILQDIPFDFRGLTTLKLNNRFMDKKLEFYSNIPVIVYIARFIHYPNPVPTDFEDTGEFMSLLQIKKPNPAAPAKRIVSDRSVMMKIYKKKYFDGKITIPLSTKSINAKGIPMVVFFGFDSTTGTPIACGGKEEWISNPNSYHYQSCDQSSYWNGNWKCYNGLNGRTRDSEGSIWASKREGVGAWLKVEFKTLYQISKVTYMDRRNPSERNSKIVATFQNGEEFVMNLGNLNEVQEFQIDPPIKSSFVKFTIKGIYGSINNGGAFKVFGTKCIDPEDSLEPSREADGLAKVAGINSKALPPLFKIEDKKPIVLNCKDSLSNTKKLDHIRMKQGSRVIVKCVDSCANAPGSIYGDMKYSKDSAICKAAFHSQKLKAGGGLVEIIFEMGQVFYRGQTRNGIKSKNKGKSDITLTFEKYEQQEDIIVENGSKVDVKVKGKWMPGVINQVRDGSEGKVLAIGIEGSDAAYKPLEIAYPNKSRIQSCGEHVKDRDCKGSRTHPNTNRPIKIKFAPDSFNTPGDYLLDKGELFGKSGYAFGWSKDMTSRMRMRQGASKPELETLAEFPPAQNSRFCATPGIMCDKVNWSVKTGHGKFNVKLYVGDPQANTRVDLKVNDQFIVKGKTIPRGQLEVFEGSYDAMNEHLIISTDCLEDCNYAMSKLNMVEIFPFNSENRKEEDPSPEKQDPCGGASEGGRCDQGPDVVHCVYEDPSAEGAKFCTGSLLMVQVSKQYRCPSQRDKFKCVKRRYKDQGECLNFCPGKCESAMCL